MTSSHEGPTRRVRWAPLGVFIAIFVLFSAGIAFLGWTNFTQERIDIEHDRRRDLETIAGLKAGQISGWRANQLHLARILRADVLANEAVAGSLADAFPGAKQRLEAWMDSMLTSGEYRDVLLFDAEGTFRLARAGDPQAGEHAREAMAKAMRSRQPVFSDLHRDTVAGMIHIDMAIPLLTGPDGPAAGVLIFRLDPRIFLFPLIQSWPVPSVSAETLLVRRDGADVLYLNELRHREGTALALRLPLERPDLPAAIATRGEVGPYRGVDYRGVKVIFAARAVPETPWVLVSKIDEVEVLGPLRARARTIALFSFALVLAVGAFLSFLWRTQETRAVRRQAEDAERHGALLERYRHLTLQANDAILLLDTQGRVREANERAAHVFGRSPEALVGTNMSELRDANAPSTPEERLLQVNAGDGALYESLYRRRDGTPFPVEVSARSVESGGQRYNQLIVRDITERRERERRVADSLAFNRRLLETLPVGIVAFKASGPCVVANPAIARMVGAKVEDILRQNFRELESWKQSEMFATAEAALATGIEKTAEARTISSFGREVWFSCRMVPFAYEGEAHFVALLTDIAEQRLAEEGLKESEQRYRALFENSLDAVLLTNPDGSIVEANPAACRIFGRNEAELRRLGRAGVVSPDDPKTAEAVAERARTGRFRGVLVFVRADGSRFPGEISSAVFLDKQGRARSSMIIRDITEQKKAEEDLRRQRELLRRLAVHLQSVREDEWTQMSREIHDELGQALTGLRFDLAWLRKRTEETGLEAKIASMDELLDSTIDWARRISMRLRPSLLDDLGLIPALDWLARDLQERTDLSVSFVADPGVESVRIGREEATALFRICQESLTNVAKHAGAKRVEVSLRLEGARLVLEVCDDGRGIGPDDLAKAASFGIQGMHERAAVLDGEVRIESHLGQGTTVTVVVPVR